MNLIYGRWTAEEFEKRRPSVFEPFKDGGRWLRVKELVVGPLGANYQAEEVPEPEAASAQSAQTIQPPGPPKEVVVPPPIRSWARKKGLLPKKTTGDSRGNGPAFLPKEIRDAYREEFGPDILAQMLRSDSLDARRLYADEGDTSPGPMYKVPSQVAQETLRPEEIQTLYREVPRTVSEARVKAREASTGSREEKRQVARTAGKQITDPIVQQRTVSLVKRTEGTD